MENSEKQVFIIRHALESKIKNESYIGQIQHLVKKIIEQLQNDEEAITILTGIEDEKITTTNALKKEITKELQGIKITIKEEKNLDKDKYTMENIQAMREQIQRTKDEIVLVITNLSHARYSSTPSNDINPLEAVYFPLQGKYQIIKQTS